MPLFSRSNSRSRLGLFFVLLLMFAAGLGLYTSLRGVAHAAGPQIWLSQKVGPPTTIMQVHGYGFGHSETVLVDFETTPAGTAITDATGKFVVRITVPKAALPGTLRVQATGQSSGLTAQNLFLVRTDWDQLGFGPRHAGYNPYENVLSLSNVSALTLGWSYSTGGNISLSPVMENGMMYVVSDKLYALDAVTGVLRWSFSTGNNISLSPAVENGVVYVGSDKLYALDAVTGVLKWSYTTGSSISSLAVANGVVYIGSDNALYSLDAMTGILKWSYITGGGFISSPAVANAVVYIGSDRLYALDAVTGTLKWSYSTGHGFSDPAVADGVVYVSSHDIVGSGEDKLYSLDAMTGTLKWSYATDGHIYSSPAVAKGVVYVSSDGVPYCATPPGCPTAGLYALDAVTGAARWAYGAGGAIAYSSPTIANGVLYVDSYIYCGCPSSWGELEALNAVTGAPEWSYTTANVISSPVVANGVIYVGSDRLYAFDLPGVG